MAANNVVNRIAVKLKFLGLSESLIIFYPSFAVRKKLRTIRWNEIRLFEVLVYQTIYL